MKHFKGPYNPSRRLLAGAGLLSLALAASACGASSTSTPSATPAGTQVQRGGTLDVGVNAQFNGLDPDLQPNQAVAWIDSLVYSRLLRLTPQGQIIGDLATSWQQTSSTSYVFHLRHGVKFDDGSSLTSADVKYSIERVLNPATADENAAELSAIQTVTTPDQYTVDITLSSPDAAILTDLATYVASVVPQAAVAANGNLNTTMDGSGAFEFASESGDTQITLKANPHYYVKGEPYLSEVVVNAVADTNTRTNALLSGGDQLINFVASQSVASIKSAGDTVGPGTAGNFYALMMFEQDPPFNNLDVRQAVMYALNRQAIFQASTLSQGTVLEAGPIPSFNQYALKTAIYPSADLTKAESLMKASGVAPFTTTLGAWSGQPYVISAAQVIQQELQPLGITVKIQQYGDYPSYNEAVFVNHQDGMTIQGFGGNLDPDQWLYKTFTTTGGYNFFGYSDSTVDSLLMQGRQTSGFSARYQLYAQAQQIIATNGPMAFLYSYSEPEAWTPAVQGFQHYPDVSLDGLVTTWLKH
jgi:peptide/nickel transport system substrate-binding protein